MLKVSGFALTEIVPVTVSETTSMMLMLLPLKFPTSAVALFAVNTTCYGAFPTEIVPISVLVVVLKT